VSPRELEGSIRQRPSGTWEVRLYLGRDPATGRPRYQYRTAPTETEAHKLAKRLRRDRAAGDLDPGTDRTLGTLAAEWETSGFARQLSPNTRANYKANLRLHITPHLGPLTLERLEHNPKIVHDYQEWLTAPKTADATVDVTRRAVTFVGGAGMKPATARKIRTALASVLTAAVVWGYMRENPVRKVPPPKPGRHRRQAVDPADVARLLLWAETHDPAFCTYLWVASDAGARRGEVCGARWDDVNWDDGTLTLARVVLIGEHGVELRDSTKTDKDRVVALSQPTLRHLAAHQRRVSEKLSEAAGRPVEASGYIFGRTAVDGRMYEEPWRPDGNVSRKLRRIRDHLKLDPTITLHGLRHTMVTQMLRLGVDIATVAGRAGHGAGTALGTYNHKDLASDRAAAELYAAALEAELAKLRAEPD
jgi:integrase